MSIGLFLDVDNTLTVGFIQAYFAQELGCAEEYGQIESDFQADADADRFGARLIELFAAREFTEAVAARLAPGVPLQNWTKGVLRLPVDRYLVSSGPSYFVKYFAEANGIHEDHVMCSEYSFGGSNGVINDCDAVNGGMKADFVARHAKGHAVTIGVGDKEDLDGPFLTHCMIPIIARSPSQEYLTISSFASLLTILQRLSDSPAITQNMARDRPRVFIGSSTAQLPVAKALHTLLGEFCEPNLWPYTFDASLTAIEALEKQLMANEFAVMVLGPDDRVESRSTESWAPRDNLVLEFGMFMGKLGRDRSFLLQPEDTPLKLPSDLNGVTVLRYRNREDKDYKQALTGPVDQLRDLISNPDRSIS